MIEKKWPTVPPRLFTADGTNQGIINLATTAGFKVKQKVVLKATSLPDLELQVKRVNSPTQLKVGPIQPTQGNWYAGTDVSAYTLALGAFMYAVEQDRVHIKPDDIFQAIYDQEPTVAIRSVIVDQFGNYFDSVIGIDGLNRLAVDAEVTVSGVTVNLDAFTKVPPDNAIAVGTEDGTKNGIKHAIKIDPNGNLNVIDMGKLVPEIFDDVDVTNSVIAGETVPTLLQYFTGGPSGTLVATLTVTYDGGANITRIRRT